VSELAIRSEHGDFRNDRRPRRLHQPVLAVQQHRAHDVELGRVLLRILHSKIGIDVDDVEAQRLARVVLDDGIDLRRVAVRDRAIMGDEEQDMGLYASDLQRLMCLAIEVHEGELLLVLRPGGKEQQRRNQAQVHGQSPEAKTVAGGRMQAAPPSGRRLWPHYYFLSLDAGRADWPPNRSGTVPTRFRRAAGAARTECSWIAFSSAAASFSWAGTMPKRTIPISSVEPSPHWTRFGG